MKTLYKVIVTLLNFIVLLLITGCKNNRLTITIGNLESPMAGAERGYSSYSAFNAPEDLAVDLKELGVDIMSTANNHCLDKGFRGGSSTLGFLDLLMFLKLEQIGRIFDFK